MAGIKLTDKPVGSVPNQDDTKVLVVQKVAVDDSGTMEVVRQVEFSQLRSWVANQMVGIMCGGEDIAAEDSRGYSTDANTCGVIAFFGTKEDSFGVYLVNVGPDKTILDNITAKKVVGPDVTKIYVGGSYGTLIIGNHTEETIHARFINLTPNKGLFPNARFVV